MNKKCFSTLLAMLAITTLLVSATTVTAHIPDDIPEPNSTMRELSYKSEIAFSPEDTKDVSLGEPGTSFSYVETFGFSQAAYFDDTSHLNFPVGLAVDQTDNVYIFEESGKRMLKYDSSGVFQYKIGVAGLEDSNDYNFSNPQDGVIDLNNNIWVAESHRVVAYNSTGGVLLQIPEIDAWQSGTENGRFNHTTGVAFDSLGRLYVSDCNNQRIQIFEFDTEGNPVWIHMLGETEVSGNDNFHFKYPERIAIQNDLLFVADSENHRIQVFDVSNSDPTLFAYLTTIGTSGDPGNDNDHLDSPFGVAANSDFVAISEGNNNRIQIYNRSDLQYIATAVTFGTDPGYTWNPRDVVFDSSSNLYIADSYNHRVELFIKQAGANWTYNRMIGTTNVPYLTDNYHFNNPRVAIDGDNNLIVIEEKGQRLSKFDENRLLIFSIGTPGIHRDPNRGNNDNEHFNWPHGVAVDNNGKIYVADNSRVQIYSPSGSYVATIGADWYWGSGDYEFGWVTSLAVSPTGLIYVSDGPNHRVQIYNSSYTFIGTLGETGVSGSDNSHFNYPMGVEVDSSGNIFVADINNCRVQKFDSDNIYQLTFGTCGNYDNQIGNVNAEDVTVDSLGRVYVAGWMNRVDVFDPDGDYLTTIGGIYGNKTSQFEAASGVAVDKDGLVFVSDFFNHRIQKFVPGYPDWTQININGFGEIQNQVITTLQTVDDVLYAGTYNPETGGQIWTSTGNGAWSQLTGDGFGNPYNVGINHIMEFKDKIYVSTWADETEGGELWRINNPTDWSRVVNNGFGDPTNGEIWHLTEFNNQLYAFTWSYTDTHGADIWRSPSGDQGTWSQVASNGFNGDVNNVTILSTSVFNGYIYVGTRNTVTGGEIWRSSTGSSGSWAQVFADGLGEGAANADIVLTVFNGSLFAGTRNKSGGQIWQSSNGTEWTKVSDSGFGDVNNIVIENLFVFNDQLIAVAHNNVDGMEVWVSSNGFNWDLIAENGFGDNNNPTGFWNHSSTIFDNQIILGTDNIANGGEIWQYDGDDYMVYLPVLLKNYSSIVDPSWKIASSPVTSKLNDVFSLSSSDIWAVGNAGVILHRNTSNWSSVSSPIANNLNSVFMISSTDGWAVGDGGVIIHWNGSNWSTSTSPTSNKLNAVSMNSSTDGWAVGDGGVIIRWNGSNWSSVTSPTTYNLEGLAFISGTNGWAVGGGWNPSISWFQDTKLKWDGSNWTLSTSYRILDILYDVDFTSPSYGWAAGQNSAKAIWNGTSWVTSYGLGDMIMFMSLDMLSNIDGWAVGWGNLESNISHWDGTTWAQKTSPVGGTLYGLTMISTNEGWAVGENGLILHFTAGTP